MNQKYEIDMCNGPIMSKLISFSLPLMFSGILQLLFNAVDIIVVGRFCGDQSMAAVGSTTSLIFMFINLFFGTSLGANVMAARYVAQKEDEKVFETVHTAITMALIFGFFIMIVGLLGSRPALVLMGNPDDCIDKATLYMRIYFLGMPFFMVYNYGAAILRAVGDTKRPLIFLMVAGISNMFMNLFLVVVVHLDVAGVAIATVLSQFISCILVVICLIKTQGNYRLYFSKLHIHPVYMKQILQVGVPAGLQSVLINFSNVLLQSSVNSFGSVSMAGYTAANNILGFLYQTVNAFTQACMSFTSQNLGAHKPKRMDLVFRDCLILDCSLPIACGVLVYFLSPWIFRIYTTSQEVINCGMEVLVITALPYFLCGLMDLLPGALRGMGYSTVPMILSLLGVVGVRVIWITQVFPYHRSLFWLFISYPVSWIITIMMQVVCYYFVRRKVHKQLQMF